MIKIVVQLIVTFLGLVAALCIVQYFDTWQLFREKVYGETYFTICSKVRDLRRLYGEANNEEKVRDCNELLNCLEKLEIEIQTGEIQEGKEL